MTTRPLTKEVLKKMYLKALWEATRPTGKLSGTSHGVDSILHPYQSSLAGLFQLPNLNKDVRSQWSLTAEERVLALQGVEELQRDGFLMNDPGQGNDNFKILTDKGRAVAEQDLADMKVPSVDIEKVLSRADLLNRVRGDFLNGEYDSAILKAFKQVEEAVRAKAKQLPFMTGHDLMVAAFAPTKGRVEEPGGENRIRGASPVLLVRRRERLVQKPDCTSHRWLSRSTRGSADSGPRQPPTGHGG